MNIKKTIEAVDNLINLIGHQAPQERLVTYSVIKQLISEIKEYAKDKEEIGEPIPNVGVYLTEMIEPLRGIAGLKDIDPDDSRLGVWLCTGVDKLRSVHCFNI